MSFLAEVLSSAEKIEIQNLIDKVPKLSVEVSSFKSEVIKSLDSIFVNFAIRMNYITPLLDQANSLREELSKLNNTLEEVSRKEVADAEIDATQFKKDLEKTDIILAIVEKLIQIHNGIKTVIQLQEQKRFSDAMKELCRIDDFAQLIPDEEKVEAVNVLINKLEVKRHFLLNAVLDVFKDNVTFVNEAGITLLRIKRDEKLIGDTLLTLSLCSSNVAPLNELTKFLWNEVFVVIVDNTVNVEVNEEDQAELKITVDKHEKCHYKIVYDNLRKVLIFLSRYFDFPLKDNLSTLSCIGRDLRDNLSELIIKRCLEDTIPSSDEGLQRYQEVIENTKLLQTELIASKIFDEDTTSILEYANNIDILFINKKCQEYAKLAHSIMMKDLHDTVEVGVHEIMSPNDFPHCSISKSCIELLNLAESLLQQCVTSSDVCSGRILCTVQNMFHSYQTVVPEHHQKFLQTIPQQVALFYNNCLYIAHNLTKWNVMFKGKLPATIITGSVIFESQPHKLQIVGSTIFSKCVQQQIKQLGEIVEESGLCRLQLEENLPATVEKSIRQCLRQQELLKTVWQKVLPYSTYNKTLGNIFNSFCTFLINPVLGTEDIPSRAAEQLVDVYKVVVTRGPKLFIDPKETCLYVEQWKKLNELIFVLNSTLIGINDRWADKKGPLASEFTAEEMRNLIKALFQNTDRRAYVLSKLHD